MDTILCSSLNWIRTSLNQVMTGTHEVAVPPRFSVVIDSAYVHFARGFGTTLSVDNGADVKEIA
ncbi:conserved hypothetical protein [Histoplasma capsulatum H143]|uniref:Uncharacterized protein n=1 Tax=Ajellomyces capsulatus (strain H143) TaxID=544712 RepID=C6HEZ0_AJECH|nr:conserved hypothetical protein [Histoplasma capsulatum H143]